MRVLLLVFLTFTTVIGAFTGALAAFMSSAVLQDEGLTARSLLTISISSVVPLILTAALVVSHSEGNKDKLNQQRLLLRLNRFVGLLCAVGASAVIGYFVQEQQQVHGPSIWTNIWGTVAIIISILCSLAVLFMVRTGLHYLLYLLEEKRKQKRHQGDETAWLQDLDFDAWEKQFKGFNHHDG